MKKTFRVRVKPTAERFFKAWEALPPDEKRILVDKLSKENSEFMNALEQQLLWGIEMRNRGPNGYYS